MKSFQVSAFGLIFGCGSALAEPRDFDGIYRPYGDDWAYWDCETVGGDGGAFQIKENSLTTVETVCTLTNPSMPSASGAVTFDASCSGEGMEWPDHYTIEKTDFGVVVTGEDGYSSDWQRCGVDVEERRSRTQSNSDVMIQADIVFWQTIANSGHHQDFDDYLKQFPDGQFAVLAQRRLIHTKTATKGRALLHEFGSEAMNVAVRGNDIYVLEWLKTQGADINARGLFGQTPMHFAAENNAVDAMAWLKEQGADINARDSDDQTPMHTATESNAVDAMAWLKAQGGDINVRDNHGGTPMHDAAQKLHDAARTHADAVWDAIKIGGELLH